MKIVIALGGNALGSDPVEQLEKVKTTAKTIIDLFEMGHQIVVGHGNGPQVGSIYLAFDESSKINEKIPSMPLVESVAMSQGYIGYHIQQAIKNELMKRQLKGEVVSLLTQVLVDSNDPAFINPSKPIGPFYTIEQVEAMNTWERFIEDAGRGYRKVVASPQPKEIVELQWIKEWFKPENIVITVGGGGIPVIIKDHQYHGVEAVIDKDASCAKLARDLDADILLILTEVESVYLNYNSRNEQKISKIAYNEIDELVAEGHFAQGSMLPKIKACQNFLQDNFDKKAIITSLEKAPLALTGRVGTMIEH